MQHFLVFQLFCKIAGLNTCYNYLRFVFRSFCGKVKRLFWPSKTGHLCRAIFMDNGYAWINASGLSWSSPVNKRRSPNTLASVVGALFPTGELVQITGDTFAEGAWIWRQYKSSDSVFWVRSDVYKEYVLNPSGFVLDVPYVSQHGDTANKSYNDCGPASSCMLLAYDGVDTTVNRFMAKAGITHTGTTGFSENISGIKTYGYDAAYKRMHLTDILHCVEVEKKPVFSLVYYNYLNPGQRYGHFLVVLGYKWVNDSLEIVFHDPYRSAFMSASAGAFANALANKNGNANQPFQSLIITNYKNAPKIPAESEGDLQKPEIPPTHSSFEVAVMEKLDSIYNELRVIKSIISS